VRKQLVTASNTIEDTGRHTRAMEQRLRHVEELSPDLAVTVLGLEEPSPEPDAA
jgi:DNA anti-recombination protein RmuC